MSRGHLAGLPLRFCYCKVQIHQLRSPQRQAIQDCSSFQVPWRHSTGVSVHSRPANIASTCGCEGSAGKTYLVTFKVSARQGWARFDFSKHKGETFLLIFFFSLKDWTVNNQGDYVVRLPKMAKVHQFHLTFPYVCEFLWEYVLAVCAMDTVHTIEAGNNNNNNMLILCVHNKFCISHPDSRAEQEGNSRWLR